MKVTTTTCDSSPTAMHVYTSGWTQGAYKGCGDPALHSEVPSLKDDRTLYPTPASSLLIPVECLSFSPIKLHFSAHSLYLTYLSWA